MDWTSSVLISVSQEEWEYEYIFLLEDETVMGGGGGGGNYFGRMTVVLEAGLEGTRSDITESTVPGL